MGDMADLIIEQGMWQYMEEHPPLPTEPTGQYLRSMFSDKGERMAVVKRTLPVGTKKKKGGRIHDTGADTLDLTLPDAPSAPSTSLQDYTTLLFGEKKIGKTDLSAQFPNTFHLMAEPGGKAQAIFQRPVNGWKEFTGYVKLLEKDKKFRTVVVDTADSLYNYCFDFSLQKLGIDHPADEAYGKGWKAIRDEFEKWIRRLINTGKGIIFISHATDREIKMRDGEKYHRLQPTMGGQARDVLEALVDLWFYYGYDGSRRVLTIQGSDYIGAGHRLKNNFTFPDGTPVTEIDMGASAEEGYANLLAAFNNKYQKPKEETPATVIKKKKKLTLKKG